MNVTILGTGAGLPAGNRHQTGLLIDHQDTPLLVDAGSGVFHRLAETNTPLAAIDTVLLTHCHLDHVADLTSIAKARWLDDHTDFTIVGPPGTADTLEPLFTIDDLHDRLDLTIEEIDPGQHTVKGVDVTARKTTHSAYCLAYRFEEHFVFSGDSEAIPAIAELADGCQALLHDCAFTDDEEDPSNHATPTALGELLQTTDTDVDAVYLTHLYPEAAANATQLRETVQSYVDAEVHIATDGDQLSIS